jgi:hypothetical protein
MQAEQWFPRLMTRAEQMEEEEDCEHEFDPDEGFTCINCGEQGELSDCYDEDYGKDR